jgi:IclR family transcriptional regulator, KDG regulon repressor
LDAINKALEILELFLHSDEELSINDVSKRTHITYPTAHRITSILVKKGYLIQPEKRGAYAVHPAKLADYISIIRKKLNLRTVASPYLYDLSQTVDEAVLLAVRRGQVAFNIDAVNRGRLLNVTPESGTLGLYYTGAGKIFLAYLSEKELGAYLNNQVLAQRTSRTIKDKGELVKHLNEVRRNGVAFDDEENELGLRSVAAPIKDWEDRVVAAVSIIGPSARITKQRLLELAPVVRDYAQRISQAMGMRIQ